MVERFWKKSSAFLTIIFIVSLVLSLSASTGCQDAKPPKLPSQANQAAQILLSSVSVPSTSTIIFAGPVEPGTVLREDVADGEEPVVEDGAEEEGPVELKVPDTAGTYYAFFIDDHPYEKYEHPVRYAYVNVDTRVVDCVDSLQRMTIFRPNRQPEPFTLIAYQEIDDVSFLFAEGDGTGVAVNETVQPEAKFQLIPYRETEALTSIAGDKANSVQLLTSEVIAASGSYQLLLTANAGSQSGAAGNQNSDGNLPLSISTLKGDLSGKGELSGAPESDGSRKREKHAIVIDGGDKNYFLPGHGNTFWDFVSSLGSPIDYAPYLAEQADAIQGWLEGNEFMVWRTSQCIDNNYERLAEKNAKGNLTAEKLDKKIDWYIERFTSLGPPSDGCDELFIYISAHGGPDDFEVYALGGKPGCFTNVRYDQMFTRLMRLPPWTKVTLFIDTCRASAVHWTLKGYKATWSEYWKLYQISVNPVQGRPDHIEAFMAGHCSLTIIAVCDERHGADSGAGPTDSGTEDFMQGADKNLDGDNTTGDIQDRFLYMKQEGEENGPEAFHYPAKTSWCSLDGDGPDQPPERPRPVIQPSPTEVQNEYRIGETCPKPLGAVIIYNVGIGELQWSVSGNIPGWLDVQPQANSTMEIMFLQLINGEQITEPGVLTAKFQIVGVEKYTKDTAANSPVDITVKVTVHAKAPQVTPVTPGPGETDVETKKAIKIGFSLPMNTKSVEEATTISPLVEYTSVWSENNTIMTLTPVSDLDFKVNYTLVLDTKAMSSDGGYLQEPFSLTFTTQEKPVIPAPQVVSTIPQNEGTSVQVTADIQLLFSVPMDEAATLEALSVNSEINYEASWSEDSKLLTLYLSEPLQSGTLYEIIITDAARSKAGINLDTTYSVIFETG